MKKVTCAVCQYENYELVTHVGDHQLTPREYVAKYREAVVAPELMRFVSETPSVSRTPVISGKVSANVAFGDKNISIPFRSDTYGDSRVPVVDPGFIMPPEMEYVYDAIKRGEHCYIHGETGLGKSDAIDQLAAYMGIPRTTISMTGETVLEHFMGYLGAEKGDVGKDTYFHGTLPVAMKEGQGLFIEEFDYCPPRVAAVLNTALASGRILIPETGEVVEAAPGFFVVALANTSGAGDETGFYQATNAVNRALLDRFSTTVIFDFPSEERLLQIIESRVGKLVDTRSFLKFVKDIRSGVENNEIYAPFGVRAAIKFAAKLQFGYNAWIAAKLSFANNMDSGSREVVRSLIDRNYGNVSQNG